MILVDTGERSERALEAAAHLTRQLARLGHRAAICEAAAPAEMPRPLRYEVAPVLADPREIDVDALVILGAETLAPALLSDLRALALPPAATVAAFGRFADHQARLSAEAHLMHAFGRAPVLHDLAATQPRPLAFGPGAPLMAVPAARRETADRVPALLLHLPPELAEDPVWLAQAEALAWSRQWRLTLLVQGRSRDALRASRFAGLPAIGLGEFSPSDFAARADVAAFFGNGLPGDRLAGFALDLMASGGVVVDCTEDQALVATGAPVLRGQPDLAALGVHLAETVLRNREEIGRQTAASAWLAAFAPQQVAGSLFPANTAAPAASAPRAQGRTVFLPTNGVGLGHARRCLLIAGAMAPGAKPVFAAFPSCVPMIAAQGHACLPLVSRSDRHVEPYANDILNYLRLGRLLGPGDRLVFDGGYVFDSVYRLVVERGLAAVWLRRGLWQPGQSNTLALEREAAFRRVIVPGEAFAELMDRYSYGRHVHETGPVFDETAMTAEARFALRGQVAARFGRVPACIAVSMLGGGVAAERTAQLQALCALFDAREDVLHLIVVWPGGVVAPALHGWKNSRVVETLNARALCQAADFVISAAGYNSFHELLYHGVPTIFVPQMAAYMDDQERRARSASERDVAVTVLAHEIMTLTREVQQFLDDGKADILRARLADLDLPEPGTRDAAALIESVEDDGDGR